MAEWRALSRCGGVLANFGKELFTEYYKIAEKESLIVRHGVCVPGVGDFLFCRRKRQAAMRDKAFNAVVQE